MYFSRDKVFRITPNNEEQLDFLKNWLYTAHPVIDVWRPASEVGVSMDVHIRNSDISQVIAILKINKISYKIIIEDIQKNIGEESSNKKLFSGIWPWSGFDYEDYNRYGDIVKRLRYVAEKFSFKSHLVQMHLKTTKGRRVYGLKVHQSHATKSKPAVILDGSMHARDWITTAVLVYMTKLLIEPEETDMKKKIDKVLKHYDIYIFPTVNPDGYEYTHDTDRLHKKTLSHQDYSCLGVNMDRNFKPHWGENGLDKEDPCSGLFPGTRFNSEPEVQNIVLNINTMKRLGVKSYWTLRGFGQHIRYPYGYRTAGTWWDNELNRIATAFASGASKRYGKKYTAGRASSFEGVAGGQAIDWAYDDGGIYYSYAAHLRPGYGDNSGNTFILPDSEIKPTSLEFIDGFLDAMVALIDG